MAYFIKYCLLKIFPPVGPMDPQRCFDVAYSVRLAGTSDHTQLVRCMFFRCGRRVPANEIIDAYKVIAEEALLYGYSEPLHFIADYYRGDYSEAIPLYFRPIDPAFLQSIFGTAMYPPEAPIAEPAALPRIGIITPDCTPVASPRPRKPVQTPSTGLIPQAFRTKAARSKSGARYFREMTLREREIDTQFDYFTSQAMRSESAESACNNLEFPGASSLLGEALSDFDVEFQAIISKIRGHGRMLVKDKSHWQESVNAFAVYFEKKFGIDHCSENAMRRLASAVAHLMKKLQIKIFECRNSETLRELAIIKAQLGQFYGFYRR